MILAVGLATIIAGVALIVWQLISAKRSRTKHDSNGIEPIVSRRQFQVRFAVGILVVMLGGSILAYFWKSSALMGAWSLFVAVTLVLVIVTLVVLDMTWSLKHVAKHLKSVHDAEKELQQAYMEAKRRQKSQQGNGKL